jgi:hypothetical protein
MEREMISREAAEIGGCEKPQVITPISRRLVQGFFIPGFRFGYQCWVSDRGIGVKERCG